MRAVRSLMRTAKKDVDVSGGYTTKLPERKRFRYTVVREISLVVRSKIHASVALKKLFAWHLGKHKGISIGEYGFNYTRVLNCKYRWCSFVRQIFDRFKLYSNPSHHPHGVVNIFVETYLRSMFRRL